MHQPVLVREVLSFLYHRPDGVYLDATYGGGGHTQALLAVPGFKGKVIGIDRDPQAKPALDSSRFAFYPASFSNLPEVLSLAGVSRLSGVLFDFGLSSLQLDDSSRGFSFQAEGPLDMRFDLSQALTAEAALNEYPEEKLADVFYRFGEEPKARSLARFIVRARQKERISTTGQLRQLLLAFWKRPNPRRFLARIFQALRMEVNQELENIRLGLEGALPLLESGGRVVAISYHSLEDRAVKEFFRRESKDCLCPPELPECRCGHTAALGILTAKPVIPALREKKENPRSASAKLRAAEKL